MPPMGGPGGPPPRGMRNFLTEEEKANKPKVTKAMIIRILSYLKPYWLQFIFVFIMIFLSSVVGLLPSIITGKIVDEALYGKDMQLLLILSGASFGTLLLSRVITVLESYVNPWISQQIIYDMKNQMYDHLQHMSHRFFSTEKQGEIITRMNGDINGVRSVISGTLTSIVNNILVIITTLAALFGMNWKLAIVSMFILPFLILPTRQAGHKRWTILRETQSKHDKMNQLVNETLSVSGSMLVKLFTREEKEYKKFEEVNKEVTKLSMKEHVAGQWFRMVMGIFTNIGPILIYLVGGYILIKDANAGVENPLTVGTITAVVALVNRLYSPVSSLLNLEVDFVRSLALFERIFDYYDRPFEIVNASNAVKKDEVNGDISFEKVFFEYEAGQTILKNINFTIPKGKMYALVGPSGSGKSTITNLIPRLYDVSMGKVSIDGINVKDYDLASLRKSIGVVTQDTYLFNGTIKENLLYAKDDATDKEIIEACKAANIHNFIMSLPNGYDSIVGNRGLKLSGGEKQRISIARVILKNPAILILDEATSSLDSISESSIQDAIEPLLKGRTSLVIAHRLSTILYADRILVIKNGEIVENGTHEELVENNGVYKELYETQFRVVLDEAAAADVKKELKPPMNEKFKEFPAMKE